MGEPWFSLCYNKVIVACACEAIKFVTYVPKYVYMNSLSEVICYYQLLICFFGIFVSVLDYFLPFLSNPHFPAKF